MTTSDITPESESPAQHGFVPPPYPYDRLKPVLELAQEHPGGAIDLSIGTPADPPSPLVSQALTHSETLRTYPPSIGIQPLRGAVSQWYERRLGLAVDPDNVGACVGAKEFVAGLPHWLKLARPDLDTVLYPAVSYPSYAMGAQLANCRAVAVPVKDDWTMDFNAVSESDRERALCLWVNSPANPTGICEDLSASAAWGREHSIPVFSDECYIDFTWVGPNRGQSNMPGNSIIESGNAGVVAVHSLSKRSNFAGGRIGFYTGDPDLVHYLQEVRKHVGLMPAGPTQAAAVVALGDDDHVHLQRERYFGRLERVRDLLGQLGIDATMPEGGFYLWIEAEDGDAWRTAEFLAQSVGVVASPGEFYGDQSAGYLRVAVVQPDDRLDLLQERVARFCAPSSSASLGNEPS